MWVWTVWDRDTPTVSLRRLPAQSHTAMSTSDPGQDCRIPAAAGRAGMRRAQRCGVLAPLVSPELRKLALLHLEANVQDDAWFCFSVF